VSDNGLVEGVGLQVLTKQEEGDMQPAKISDSQNCTKRLPGVDTKHVQKYVEL
jgi:hypothetical protein